MKVCVASCLAAVAMPLVRPLYPLISDDDEIGCVRARHLIEDLAEPGPRPDLWVVGVPSGVRPLLTHNGKLNLNVAVRGLTGYASGPGGAFGAVHAADKFARIAQPRQPDEWIAVSERRTHDTFLRRPAGRPLA